MLTSKPLINLVTVSLIATFTNLFVTITPVDFESASASAETFENKTEVLEPQILPPNLNPETVTIVRDSFTVKLTPPPPPPAPRATSNPSQAQQYALEMVLGRGWGESEYDCLAALWNKESGWRVDAANPTSGAYGIPQSLPGNKMASAGADWQTNPRTQITWGLNYIQSRYGNPCGAWNHSQQKNWY